MASSAPAFSEQEAEEVDDKRSKRRLEREEKDEEAEKEPDSKELLDGWLKDLMIGFAEIYQATVSAGHTCGDCVNRVAYPLKERVVGVVDTVSATVNPSTETRTAQGDFAAAPVFRHE